MNIYRKSAVPKTGGREIPGHRKNIAVLILGEKHHLSIRFSYRVWPPALLLLLIFLGSAISQQLKPDDRTAQVDKIVSDQMKRQQSPAMAVAVAENGSLVYSNAFGLADKENSVPAKPETLIRTGSLAKPLTAVAAMTLVELGKLDLDAPVQKYCPAFPEKPWPITTRELLTHTAGIRDYQGREFSSTEHFKNMSDGLRIFSSDPLLFEPNTRFSYTTYGYTVVGCVIEGASKKEYFDYLREHVLIPAGMTHTFVDDVHAIIPNRARGYQISEADGKIENADLMDSSYKIPGGGLVTTAEDLAHFGISLMDGKILKPETLAAMWTPTRRPDPHNKPSNYGMGFGIERFNGLMLAVHKGDQQGISCSLALVPSKRLAVVVMMNIYKANVIEVVQPITKVYLAPQNPGH
jgi:CubicO group peptidase (beta-lactamase class C family)